MRASLHQIPEEIDQTGDNSEDYEEELVDLNHIDIFSAARHAKAESLKKVLEMGVDPNSRDKFGNTILLIGAQNNYKNIVKLALRFGAKINAANNMGNTALHFCSEYGHYELGEYIKSKGNWEE